MRRRLSLLLAVVLVATAIAPSYSLGMETGEKERLDSYLMELENIQGFKGNVLVAKGGELVLKKGYGKADNKKNIDLSPEMRLPIASVTKQFVALSIMQLEEKGKLRVEDGLNIYFPELKDSDKIRLHDLLIHSSGLEDFIYMPEVIKLDLDELVPMDIVNILKGRNLKFKPGSKYDYSNTNYLLLGMIVEEVSGKSLDKYMKDNIFEPLGMENTGLTRNGEGDKFEVVPNPTLINLGGANEQLLLSSVFGAGGMYSNLDDLYKWDRSLYGEGLVRDETKKKMLKGYIDIFNDRMKSGYGWRIKAYDDKTLVFHNGQAIGYTSSMNRYVDEDITIIILSNIGQYNINRLRDDLYHILKGKNKTVFKKKDREEIVGRYEFKREIPGIAMKISIPLNIEKEDGKLYGNIYKLDPFRIFYSSKEKLSLINTDVTIDIKRFEDGKIKYLELVPYGIKFKKI